VGFFSTVFPVVASGVFAVWFHVSDLQCRRSPAKRLKTEENLVTYSRLTQANARGFTRGYRAMALALDFFFVFFLGWFMTPLVPQWEDLLAFGYMAALLLAAVFVAMAKGIANHNRPQWLVQPERRGEPGVRQQLRSESSHR
jgi:hypothetical protein